jgi:hypothetical protein
MSTEQLIHDSTLVSVTLDERNDPSGSEQYRIQNALERICHDRQADVVVLFGRAHKILRWRQAIPTSHSSFTTNDRGCSAEIFLEVCDEPAQQARIEVKLTRRDDDPLLSWLTIEFNPTTILGGNNVHPAVPRDPRGRVVRNSSSALSVVQRNLRLGFDLLDELYRQVSNASDSLYSARAREQVRRGRFRTYWVQWAAYLPTQDPVLWLQLVAVLYGQTITRGKGLIDLAAYLGLKRGRYTDDETHEVKAVLLRKLHGNRAVFSVDFYDKRRRVSQVKQGKTLTTPEKETVDDCVRMDITAQSDGVVAICKAAQSRLKKWRQSGLRFAAWPWEAEFLSGEIEPTAWWLERAVFLLSLSWEHDRLVRRSFAAWLIPHMLQEVLRLDLIASFTSRGFDELCALDHEIAAAWREIEDYGDENWARSLARAARCSPATVYNYRNKWVEEFGVDLALPYAFYRDMLFFAPSSLTDPEDRSAWLRAVRDGNGTAMVQSARRAQAVFYRLRTSVVGSAVRTDLRRMAVKVTPESMLSLPSSPTIVARPRPPTALRDIDPDQGRNRFDDDLAWLDAPERSLFGEFGRKQ